MQDLGFCEVCLELDPPVVVEAKAILQAGNQEMHLCNPHCTAMMASTVLLIMEMHQDHLISKHGLPADDAAAIVAIMAAAICNGHWQVFLMPACHVAAEMIQGNDIISRIMDGSITPEDFGETD
jgi:hypothetical protein